MELAAPRTLSSAAAALVEVATGFHRRGWMLGTSGNLSVVLEREPLRLAITASGLDKGALGQKTKVGVFQKVGKEIQVLDLATQSYRRSEGEVDPGVAEILSLKNPAEKFARLRGHAHPQAQFLWAIFRDAFHYIAVHGATIADNTRDSGVLASPPSVRSSTRSCPTPCGAWPPSLSVLRSSTFTTSSFRAPSGASDSERISATALG